MKNKKMILAAVAAGLMIMAAGCGDKERYTVYDDTKNVNADSGNSGNSGSQAASEEITDEEAKKIALDNAKVSENDVTAIRVKKEIDDGISLYNVEFYMGAKEYDYEISAADGSILSADYEVDEDFNAQSVTDGSGTTISETDAKKKVLDRVQGAKEDNIRMHLEVDDGIQKYEGTLIVGETKYEFEMNAKSGEFIEWNQESIYD